jgi:hypothetical protein
VSLLALVGEGKNIPSIQIDLEKKITFLGWKLGRYKVFCYTIKIFNYKTTFVLLS